MKKIFLYVALVVGFIKGLFVLNNKHQNKVKGYQDALRKKDNEITLAKTEAKAKELNDEINVSVNSGARDERLHQFDSGRKGS